VKYFTNNQDLERGRLCIIECLPRDLNTGTNGPFVITKVDKPAKL